MTFVRPSARIRRIVQQLVSLGRPISGNEFRGRYGRHDTLAKIALIPWVRIERSRDGFFRFTILAGTTVSVRARADLIDVFCFELLAKPLGGRATRRRQRSRLTTYPPRGQPQARRVSLVRPREPRRQTRGGCA